MRAADRHCSLEAIRGLACLMVVALHAFGMFLPGLIDGEGAGWQVAVRGSPLRLLYDGELAVFLFFVLSGRVLAAPFRRDIANPAGLALGRVVRFLPPALLAAGLGFAVARLVGAQVDAAGAMLGHGWLTGALPPHPTAAALLADGTVNALLLGYRELSPWTPLLGDRVALSDTSLDPPLWTLSLEMLGSALLLALAWCERHAPRLARPLFAFAVLITLRSPLLCFLVGYRLATRPPRTGPALALAGLGLALYLAGAPLAEAIEAARLPMLPGLESGMTLSGWVAMLIFPLLLSPPVMRLLDRPALGLLGALSFPLYLVHWPMLAGAGALVMQGTAGTIGAMAAGALAILAGLAASAALLVPFMRIDRQGLALGRFVRETLRAGATAAPATP